MITEYTSRIVPAKKLSFPFRFKLAGLMYVVEEVHPNSYDERVIHAHRVDKPDHNVTLIVGKNAPFKIYILVK